jgi:hypothetical protein
MLEFVVSMRAGLAPLRQLDCLSVACGARVQERNRDRKKRHTTRVRARLHRPCLCCLLWFYSCHRAMLFASVSALLLCAAVIALTTQDGSSMWEARVIFFCKELDAVSNTCIWYELTSCWHAIDIFVVLQGDFRHCANHPGQVFTCGHNFLLPLFHDLSVVCLHTSVGCYCQLTLTVSRMREHQADLVASAAAEAARVGSLATQKAGNVRGI